MEDKNKSFKGGIAIYNSKDNKILLEVKLGQDTVWLTQAQIAKLFQTDRSVITRHISSIFKSKELEEKSNVQKMHIALSDKPVKLYNLDVIISVGYRVNSNRATKFRIWATDILRKYLIDGYTLNEKLLEKQKRKLENLQKTISLIQDVKGKKELDYKEAMGLLDIISDYSYALGLLDDFDNQKLRITGVTSEEKFKITYNEAIKAVRQLKKKFSATGYFGVEKDDSFKSSIAVIYQTFGEKELYPGIEQKAANLLYFIVKNHSFVDGNKRIAVSIFLWFLDKNGILYRGDGTKRIADNALVALTLMIAESDPKEKDLITILVVNLINNKN